MAPSRDSISKTVSRHRSWEAILAIALILLISTGLTAWFYHREISRIWSGWQNQLPQSVYERLHKATSATLYSIYPESRKSLAHRNAADPARFIEGKSCGSVLTLSAFNDYPVLGQVHIEDTTVIRAVADDLKLGTSRDASSKCFFPRHGLRIKDGIGTLDLVICFECTALEIFENGTLTTGHVFAFDARPVSLKAMHQVFEQHSIPLASDKPGTK